MVTYPFSVGSPTVASGHVVVYGCDYASLCNEVVTDERGRVLFVPLDTDKNQVTLTAKPGTKVSHFSFVLCLLF